MLNGPRARYAWNRDVAIAYAVIGDGPIDLMYVSGGFSDVEKMWSLPQAAAFFERLASWSRLITVDRRGVGMSDRLSPGQLPPLEDAARDVLCVLDAVGSEKVALLGHNEGGHLCAMLGASVPERVRSLSLYTTPVSKRQQEVEDGNTEEAIERDNAAWERTFGTAAFEQDLFSYLAPSYVGDPEVYAFLTDLMRHAASPSSFAGFIDLLYDTDISGILGSIRVPTQVLHRTHDRVNPISWSRRLAEGIASAEFVELEGQDWWPFLGDADALLDAVERFVIGAPVGRSSNRALGTVVFTDIVASTAHVARLGDAPWKELLARHDVIAKREIDTFGGRYVQSTGDGLFALFDGPAKATSCAVSMVDAVRDLDLEIRAGVHTGEIEHASGNVRGLAVHIGSRVADLSGPSEVWVSSTVKDLVAGSGLVFEDAGEHELKGVPDRWRLFRVVDTKESA